MRVQPCPNLRNMNGKVIGLLAIGLAVIGLMTFNRPGPSNATPPPSQPAVAEQKARLRLPAPRITSTPTVNESPDELRPTNLYTRLVNGDVPKLSAEQIETYLTQNKRNAESLLAAFRASSDPAFLKEAEEK